MNQSLLKQVLPSAELMLVEADKSVDQIAQQLAQEIDAMEDDGAFLVMDAGRIIDQMIRWRQNLPRVQPFYAVKCNSDKALLEILAVLGAGFDCASRAELQLVINGLHVTPDRVIYANPCKTRSHIAHAARTGVDLMTFDNIEELYKFNALHPTAQLADTVKAVLRIAVSDETAQCPLNLKFGCDPGMQAEMLLHAAAELDVDVVGVSFHIGSGAHDATAWAAGIAHARRLFNVGIQLGHRMHLLDIGGGFMAETDGDNLLLFENAAATINQALDQHFPVDGLPVRVIAEPGRYFASSAYSIYCKVHSITTVPANRITKEENDCAHHGHMYYINDGVYGSFNCILYDHQQVHPKPLFPNSNEFGWCSIWGPTCDSLDCVIERCLLPVMNEGSWIAFDNMGAYTIAAGSTFNGFPRPQIKRYISSQKLMRLIDMKSEESDLSGWTSSSTSSATSSGL